MLTEATLQLDDRISKCRKILDADPNSQIFAALAEAYRKKGEFDVAFQVCQSGLKNHPSYGSAHLVMAKINLDRRMYDWAEIEARKAAEIDGRTRAMELLMAEIHIYKGEFNEAIKLLRQLHNADPGNNQIKKMLEIARKIPEEQTFVATSVAADTKASPENPAIIAPPGESDRPAILSSSELLKQAKGIRAVEGALFVNFEGLVVDSEWTSDLDSGLCGAAMSEALRSMKTDLTRGSFGTLRRVLIESNEYLFYLIHVEDGVFIFVARGLATLGGLRMQIENLFSRYK